jgi:hypothetical protein
MIRNSSGGGEHKKGRKQPGTRAEIASKRNDTHIAVVAEDIDPAELFDPDEFGIRRQSPRL